MSSPDLDQEALGDSASHTTAATVALSVWQVKSDAHGWAVRGVAFLGMCVLVVRHKYARSRKYFEAHGRWPFYACSRMW